MKTFCLNIRKESDIIVEIRSMIDNIQCKTGLSSDEIRHRYVGKLGRAIFDTLRTSDYLTHNTYYNPASRRLRVLDLYFEVDYRINPFDIYVMEKPQLQYVTYNPPINSYLDCMFKNYRFDDAPDTIRYAMQMFVKEKEVMPKIKKVIFNAPATIVMWEDGTKTIVKANNESFDKEKGLAMAIVKKIMGNKGNFNNFFKKYVNEDK